MSEFEDFKAGKESRSGVVSRAGHPGGSADIVQRMVDAAVYREVHQQQEPESPTEHAESDE
jgi:hypothetical protein